MYRIFIPIVILAISLLSCNDPTLVGSSLVADDVINAKQKNDFEIDVFQNAPDSLLFYIPGTTDQPSTSTQVGIINDEHFGRNEASFYIQLRPLQNAARLENIVLDSVNLELYYDSTAFYGPDIASHSLSVYRVAEEMNRSEVYYTSQSFEFDPVSISEEFVFNPRPDRNVYLIGKEGDTTSTLAPHIRIPLDPAFGEEILFMDSLMLDSDSAFIANIKGLYIKAETEVGQWLGFEAYYGGNTPTAVRIYFHEIGDTVSQTWSFGALAGGSVVLQNYSNEHEGSLAGQALTDPLIRDSLLFLQGNGGFSPGLEIKGLPGLGNVLVNKAELEFTFNGDILDYKNYPPVENVILIRKNLSGQYVNLDRSLPGIRDTISTDPVKITYTFNIPDYAQKMVDGRIFDTRLRLIPAESMTNQRRSVIFGTLDLNESIRFSLTYTEK